MMTSTHSVTSVGSCLDLLELLADVVEDAVKTGAGAVSGASDHAR